MKILGDFIPFFFIMLFILFWTVARRVPLSLELTRQEYWGGLPFPTPGDPPNPGIEPMSPALASRFFITEPPRKLRVQVLVQIKS